MRWVTDSARSIRSSLHIMLFFFVSMHTHTLYIYTTKKFLCMGSNIPTTTAIWRLLSQLLSIRNFWYFEGDIRIFWYLQHKTLRLKWEKLNRSVVACVLQTIQTTLVKLLQLKGQKLIGVFSTKMKYNRSSSWSWIELLRKVQNIMDCYSRWVFNIRSYVDNKE